jgi:FemAB-related protein (PEP-CTERM system-associated)
MEIVRCDETYREAWDQFVSTHGQGSFYHRYAWRDVNASCFGHDSSYLAAIEGKAILGVLPIVRIKSRLFGHIACSLPFVNYGGICADAEHVEAGLLREAGRVADEWGVDYLEIRSCRSLNGGLPQSGHKVSMSIDLDADSEKLWAAFKTGHRQEIRRAYKNGFEVRIGRAELLDDFYAVLSESWRDLGTPLYPKRYFDTIVRAFPEHVRLAVAYVGSEPAATAFDGFSDGTVEGMWMGAKARHRARGVNYVLYWELVKDACQRGFRRFHLGRSSAESGSETFKKKWNAVTNQLYWAYLLRTRQEIPQLNVSNPKYQLAIRAWQKLPIPVTRFVGPLLARSIP